MALENSRANQQKSIIENAEFFSDGLENLLAVDIASGLYKSKNEFGRKHFSKDNPSTPIRHALMGCVNKNYMPGQSVANSFARALGLADDAGLKEKRNFEEICRADLSTILGVPEASLNDIGRTSESIANALVAIDAWRMEVDRRQAANAAMVLHYIISERFSGRSNDCADVEMEKFCVLHVLHRCGMSLGDEFIMRRIVRLGSRLEHICRLDSVVGFISFATLRADGFSVGATVNISNSPTNYWLDKTTQLIEIKDFCARADKFEQSQKGPLNMPYLESTPSYQLACLRSRLGDPYEDVSADFLRLRGDEAATPGFIEWEGWSGIQHADHVRRHGNLDLSHEILMEVIARTDEASPMPVRVKADAMMARADCLQAMGLNDNACAIRKNAAALLQQRSTASVILRGAAKSKR